MTDDFKTRPGERSPLKKVCCLLPIWGFAYVKNFLDVALPTWLADGNLPAVSRMVETEFVFLTSREDEMYLRAHPSFKVLSATCDTSVQFIDHLITGSNYSTTITLSYLEAIRATGDDMLDTCFMFLVSDYIVADGSFRMVVERVQAGRNGVLVGNFQVVEEEALLWLTDLLQANPAVLQIEPRRLMKWALSHLHPATVANTVSYPLTHNEHTNRLFWRVDHQTLIGRFYLMHMIAIRPELREFVIGSSCDYSFVPEMCPSNNVEILGDSDDYLVIELQPRDHEAKFLKPGPQKIDKLARTLSEWTNARHRENSATTVVFHAANIPTSIDDAVAEADRFLAKVGSRLKKTPRPVRQHPYWAGAIAAFNEASGASLTQDEWRRALGLPSPDIDNDWLARSITENIRFAFFGRPPNVRPWHPRFPDYSLVTDNLADFAFDENRSLLMVADRPTIFTATFSDGGYRAVRMDVSHMLKQPHEVHEPLHGRFEVCLLEIGELDLPKVDEILDRIAPMMRDGGTVLVSLTNRHDGDPGRQFQKAISSNASRMLRPYVRSPVFSFVTSSRFREFALTRMIRLARMAYDKPVMGIPALVAFGTPLAALCGIANKMAKIEVGAFPWSFVSSALVRVTIDTERAQEAYQYSNNRILRGRKLASLGLPSDHRLPVRDDVGRAPKLDYLLGGHDGVGAYSHSTQPSPHVFDADKADYLSETTREPPRRVEIRDRRSLTSLGPMTDQVWEDDPRRLASLLARYKFVSKMLSGKKFVGEFGCGDEFGTRIVMQSTERVVAYDFDPRFVAHVRKRRSDRWPIEVQSHDILDAPLPNRHDGIYSLDVIEHIPRTSEHLYLDNLRNSLTDEGVLIIGSPSPDSQPYASPPSKQGHINCKSGEELKALLENYFENVFLFSMNDEVVHTGLAPLAHYLFAVCCQKKI